MPGFLNLFVQEVCVCVHPQAITIHMKSRLNNYSNKFQFVHMALAIDITDGYGLSVF